MQRRSKRERVKHVLLGLSSAASLATLAATSGAFHTPGNPGTSEVAQSGDSCKYDSKGVCKGSCTSNANYTCQEKSIGTSKICGCFP